MVKEEEEEGHRLLFQDYDDILSNKYDNNKSFDEIVKIMHYDNMNHYLATHSYGVTLFPKL